MNLLSLSFWAPPTASVWVDNHHYSPGFRFRQAVTLFVKTILIILHCFSKLMFLTFFWCWCFQFSPGLTWNWTFPPLLSPQKISSHQISVQSCRPLILIWLNALAISMSSRPIVNSMINYTQRIINHTKYDLKFPRI